MKRACWWKNPAEHEPLSANFFCPPSSRSGKLESFVNQYLAVLSASITTFAATNIDDAFLLTFFFARRVPTRRIVAGQYVGFAAIVAVSLIGVWTALAIPHRWIHFLGLLPIALGIKHLSQPRRTDREQSHASKDSVASIALLTFLNGADNISVYVPFFIVARGKLWLILIAYATLVALWCFVARWLGKRPLALTLVSRWGYWAVPLVFMGLGLYALNS